MAVYPHPTLPPIPVVDVRDTGLMRHCVETRDRARTLRDDCMTFMPPAARALLPMMDRITRTWLRRSGSPYVSEVEAIADAGGVCVSGTVYGVSTFGSIVGTLGTTFILIPSIGTRAITLAQSPGAGCRNSRAVG